MRFVGGGRSVQHLPSRILRGWLAHFFSILECWRKLFLENYWNSHQNRTKNIVLNGILSCSRSRWKKKSKKKNGATKYFFLYFFTRKIRKMMTKFSTLQHHFFFLLFFFQRLLEHESVPLSTLYFVLFWCKVLVVRPTYKIWVACQTSYRKILTFSLDQSTCGHLGGRREPASQKSTRLTLDRHAPPTHRIAPRM